MKYIFNFFIISVFLLTSCNEDRKEVMSEERFIEQLGTAIDLTNELRFEQAYFKLDSLLKRARAEENKKREILVLINSGLLYSKFKDYENSLPYLFLAEDISLSTEGTPYLNAIYNNIGVFYSNKKEWDKAELFFKKALELSRKNQNIRRIALNYINIASLKFDKNEMDSAYFYNSEALRMLRTTNGESFMSSAFSNLGDILIKQGDDQAALQNYLTALSYEKKYPDVINRPLFQFQIAQAYRSLGKKDSSLFYVSSSIENYESTRDFSALSEAYRLYYSITGQDSLLELAFAFRDSVDIINDRQWISNQKVSYELSKKTQEISYLEERAKTQRWIIAGILFISFNLILSILAFWRSRTRNLRQQAIILKQENSLNEIQQEKLKLDLEHKNKEVVSNTIHLMNKNEVLSSIDELLAEIPEEEVKQEIRGIIKNNLSQDADWEDFRLHFEKMHEGFLQSLHSKHPGLTQTDVRLCAYLLLGLNAKEIANISNISPDSVRKRKQRLRQKLQIDNAVEIENYLKTV